MRRRVCRSRERAPGGSGFEWGSTSPVNFVCKRPAARAGAAEGGEARPRLDLRVDVEEHLPVAVVRVEPAHVDERHLARWIRSLGCGHPLASAVREHLAPAMTPHLVLRFHVRALREALVTL